MMFALERRLRRLKVAIASPGAAAAGSREGLGPSGPI